MFVGKLGRGGVFLIPLDTDIPEAIHSTIACYSTTKMAPLKKSKDIISVIDFMFIVTIDQCNI